MNTNLPEGVGPHEGREFELMQAGVKDLALFVELKPDGLESFVEQSEFAAVEFVSPPKMGISVPVWIVWRLGFENEATQLREEYETATVGDWSTDRERRIGRLLGYSRSDIEVYIQHAEASQK
jgi:hypothetical protein